MIKIENWEVVGWEHAIRGMRNPMNSWEKSDSGYHCPYKEENAPICGNCTENICVGPNDLELMKKLAAGGSVHAKYRRMIVVYVDVTGPLFWLPELDTYKVGTVRNSCSFMHKGTANPYTINDFSIARGDVLPILEPLIDHLNFLRTQYLETKDETIFQAIRGLMPQAYMQRSTYMFNYEVLAAIYRDRKNHRLPEWHQFCDWIESLPYSELITGKEK